MAARIRAKHQDEIRAKIQASQLLNRVQNHGLGKAEISQTQLDACKYLLDKLVAKAPSETIISGDAENPVSLNLNVSFK